MPCLAIHLAVAKKYLEKHSNENKEDFILGTIAPDINMENINNYINGVSDDKNSHHFGLNDGTSKTLIEYMKKKVDLHLFFRYNDINTSFLRAYFLHLICDNCFLGDYIKDKRLEELSLMDAIKIGVNDYNLITPIVISKYNLEIPKQIKEIISNEGIGNLEILNEDSVYKFIDDMANLDLESEKKKWSLGE